jgi:hypothetical protein
MFVQHKAERAPDVEGWGLALVIDCTKEQHKRLQELIALDLAKDRLPKRPDLGKGVDSGACWDLGVYMSEIGTICTNTLVDDGSGKGTMVRACVKGGRANKGMAKNGEGGQGDGKNGEGGQGGAKHGGVGQGDGKNGEDGQGGSQLAGRGGRRHADPAGISSRLAAGALNTTTVRQLDEHHLQIARRRTTFEILFLLLRKPTH